MTSHHASPLGSSTSPAVVRLRADATKAVERAGGADARDTGMLAYEVSRAGWNRRAAAIAVHEVIAQLRSTRAQAI